jgi:6-pyruvoyltetrahydropterin/6-carboxytetrahydropterin synthase
MHISTKIIELGSCAFRQWGADHSHCHFVHGYQLKAKFWFGCRELDNKNWAVDFGALKELKAQLQDTFDHTLCVAANDPCLDLFKQLEQRDACKLRIFENGVGIERAAEHCYNVASEFIKKQYGDRCWVDQVEVFEHENNSAIYSTQMKCNETLAEVVSKSLEHNAMPEQPVPIAPLPKAPHSPRAANVGSNTSAGKGNWFAGTTWGN